VGDWSIDPDGRHVGDWSIDPDRCLSPARLALRELTRLRPALDRLEAALVDQARRDGCSWTDVASDLGVTKQSAHRRHAAHDPIAARSRTGRGNDGA
jgi:hypothetical protein